MRETPMFMRAACSAYILTAISSFGCRSRSQHRPRPANPAWVVHDHIQALEEVPRDKPSNALALQVDGFLGTERPGEKLEVTEVLYLDVFANDMEEAIGGLSKVLGPMARHFRRANAASSMMGYAALDKVPSTDVRVGRALAGVGDAERRIDAG